jgi:hypothetical protein
MLKQEIRQFSSRYLDGTLMYPGKWLCTYVLAFGSVWIQVGMESVE